MHTADFGEKIRKHRENLKLSIEEYSFICGVSKNHISKIERGEKLPRIDTAEKLAYGLNLQLSELLLQDAKTTNDINVLDKMSAYICGLNETQTDFALNFLKEYAIHIKKSENEIKGNS